MMIPKQMVGQYAKCRSALAKTVKSSASGEELRRRLEEDMMPVSELPGYLVLESRYHGDVDRNVDHFFCDLPMPQITRYVPRDQWANWARDLLDAPWGGLVLLSQESYHLFSDDIALNRCYVHWFLRVGESLEGIGAKFVRSILKPKVFAESVTTYSQMVLFKLGVGNDELVSCNTLDGFVELSHKALDLSGGA